MKVETILKAINMADYDEVKEISCSIEDLKALREHIISLEIMNKELKKQNVILDSKISLKILDRPVKLSVYA